MRKSADEPCLRRVAALGIDVGVNVQPDQELVISAPVEAGPLIAALARAAYQRGAALVNCIYDDPALLLTRIQSARPSTLDAASTWLSDGVARALEAGAAHLSVLGPYPSLLGGVDIATVRRLHASMARAHAAQSTALAGTASNTSALPFATANWARLIFPELGTTEAARTALWQVLATGLRADTDTSLAGMRRHLDELDTRRERLNQLDLVQLRFRDGNTDLRVSPPARHQWQGGRRRADNGVLHVPSLPAEELCVRLEPSGGEGRIVLPGSRHIAGIRVEDLELELCDGRVMELRARAGADALRALLCVDEGGGTLTEAGLAPASSPLGRLGRVLDNPLMDRNAGCHVRLDASVPACGPEDGRSRPDGLQLDLCLGGPQLQVEGIDHHGDNEALMRDGCWVV